MWSLAQQAGTVEGVTTAGTGLTGLLEQAEGLEDAVTDFFDGGAADAYEETKLATSAEDIAGVIGKASVGETPGMV